MENLDDSNKKTENGLAEFKGIEHDAAFDNKQSSESCRKGIQRCKNFKDLKEFFESATSKSDCNSKIMPKSNSTLPKPKSYPPVKITTFNKAQKHVVNNHSFLRNSVIGNGTPVKVKEIKDLFENNKHDSEENSTAMNQQENTECENQTVSTFVSDIHISDASSVNSNNKKPEETALSIVSLEKSQGQNINQSDTLLDLTLSMDHPSNITFTDFEKLSDIPLN
jgi:hypothetical protein